MRTPLEPAVILADLKERLAQGNLSETEGLAIVAQLTPLAIAARQADYEPYPWQVPPDHVPTHGHWLMLGGRGTGKTEAGARYVDDHMNGPPCDPRIKGGHRAAIVAPTLGDASESCVTGPSGIQTINPMTRLVGGRGGTNVIWPNGSKARLFGAYSPEDSERLRAGGNRCLVWMEEAAAMRFLAAALDHTAFGLRIGMNAHYVTTTTPKARLEIKELVADPDVIITKGRTADAHHLDPKVRAKLFKKHGGTRLGRQELDAEILDDVEGALWTYGIIDGPGRRVPAAPQCSRVVVAVDPAGSSTHPDAEVGIVVCGRHNGHGYVLSDLSDQMSPAEWGHAVVAAYLRHSADAIVVETNYGGEMALHTIKSASNFRAGIPIRRVVARRAKKLRAEPIVSLYEQARVHHVGVLSALETQMTSWDPEDPLAPSPDRIDALVHGMTDLLVDTAGVQVAPPSKSRRIQSPTRRPG